MLRYCSLGSGSSGNALVVEARDGLFVTRVLVDNGFNLRQLTERLARVGLTHGDIDAIFVTHEHSDHVAGVAGTARRCGLSVYCSAGTASAARLDDGTVQWHAMFAQRKLELGPLVIEPYAVPHDAAEPLQFVFSDGARRLGLLTDAGGSTPIIIAALARVDALILECNHDTGLLRSGSYPAFLKARVGGERGHLSNDQAAQILRRIDKRKLNRVVAAHLSAANNTATLARAALAAVLCCADEEVDVADQALGLDWREA